MVHLLDCDETRVSLLKRMQKPYILTLLALCKCCGELCTAQPTIGSSNESWWSVGCEESQGRRLYLLPSFIAVK